MTPTPPQELAFFASLTDGEGTGELDFVIQPVDSSETTYRARRRIELEHRLAIVDVYGNLRNLEFRRPGVYAVMLLVDGEISTIRPIRVMEGGDEQFHGRR